MLHPDFETPFKEKDPNFFTMDDMGQSKKNCRKKERRFNQLANLYNLDENNIDWNTMARHRESWTVELKKALCELVDNAEEMIDDHGDAFGSGEVDAWRTSIKRSLCLSISLKDPNQMKTNFFRQLACVLSRVITRLK